MQAFGDNIYRRDRRSGLWRQANSLHSFNDGSPNEQNIIRDTESDRVLIGSDYAYWGGSGPFIPRKFRDWDDTDICAGRGHKNRFPNELVASFVDWMRSLNQKGFIGEPLDWVRSG